MSESPLDGRTPKVMVTGSRGWNNLDAIYVALDALLRRWPAGFELMHGGADGADTMAFWWATDHEEVIGRSFLPQYMTHGKNAPHVRNDTMLDRADYLVAFWDGKSRGTKSVIDKAVNRGIPHEVHSPEGVEIGV